MPMSIIGSFSGIDQTMIDQLMEAERAPLKQLNQKKEDATRRKDAWKDVNTRLNSLYDKINTLGKASTFTSRKASSTNDDQVSMSVGSSSPEGVYKIEVEQLATSGRVIGGDIKNLPINKDTDLIDMSQDWEEEGSFIIRNIHGKEATIEVKKGDSLRDIVKNINEALIDGTGEDKEKLGVSATIVNGRIVLTSEDRGEGHIQLYSGEGDILSKLGLSHSERENQAGQNAKFTINGVEVESSSNEVKNVLEGTTINLHKEHKAGDSDIITIETDTEKASKAVEDFVKQYNSTMKFIEDQLDVGDPEDRDSGGALVGDGALMRLHSDLNNMVTKILSDVSKGDIKDISELGVTTVDRYGDLQFDSNKLINAMAENPDRVLDFFKGKGEDGGYSSRLKERVNHYIAKRSLGEGRKGIIDSTMDSYDNVIKDLNRQIENFNDRMEQKEERYIRTFTALDRAMMEAESQMAWLHQQLGRMDF